jgi:hypothetical protein
MTLTQLQNTLTLTYGILPAWLICIALSLLISGNYLDEAVRDLLMAMGAFTLVQLTRNVSPSKVIATR